jgi:hypothetical protein
MDWVVRHRGWIVMAVVLVAVVLATLIAGGHRGRSSDAAPEVSFGPLVRPVVGAGRLASTNGWVVSTGAERVAVYAGSRPRHASDGLLLYSVRVGGLPHRAAARLVVGAGALTLLRPVRVATVRAAALATVHFVTASGAIGTFVPETGAVSLSR